MKKINHQCYGGVKTAPLKKFGYTDRFAVVNIFQIHSQLKNKRKKLQGYFNPNRISSSFLKCKIFIFKVLTIRSTACIVVETRTTEDATKRSRCSLKASYQSQWIEDDPIVRLYFTYISVPFYLHTAHSNKTTSFVFSDIAFLLICLSVV